MPREGSRDRRPSDETGAGYYCPHYDPAPGNKRCRQYVDGGACARPDEFMCTEWLRLNEPKAGMPPPLAQSCPSALQVGLTNRPLDLFGNRHDKPAPEVDHAPEPESARKPTCIEAAVEREPVATREVPLVRTLSDEDVRSFANQGVEVCIESDTVSPFWLVPEYTGADRNELSIEHGATLAAICSTFPGTKVTSVKWAPRKPASGQSFEDDSGAHASAAATGR